MDRRDFLKLAALSPLTSVLPGLPVPEQGVQKPMSREQMYQQLYAVEDRLLSAHPNERWTVVISHELRACLCETMCRTTGATRPELLFGVPVQVSSFLPYKEINGREVHAVTIRGYDPLLIGVIDKRGKFPEFFKEMMRNT